MYYKERSEIDRVKLLFVSFFVFLIAFPYSVWGYLCFFPDIFITILAYWISSDRSKSYGMILIAGIIAILRTFFGGEFFFSVSIIALALFVSFFPSLFKSEFGSVLKITLILSVAWILLNFPLKNIGEVSIAEDILCALLKVGLTFVFSAVVFPFVKSERRDKFVFWTE